MSVVHDKLAYVIDDWRADILGPRFEQLTLPLGQDSEGSVYATLVRYIPEMRENKWWHFGGNDSYVGAVNGCDVLAVHGWSDYFFNPEHAEFWHGQGTRFFALDLRKYGRSLRPGQTPGHIDDLEEYDADISEAIAAIRRTPIENKKNKQTNNNRPLILVGHSTGGLILSLWSDRHRGEAAALVLNSPWLEFQLGSIGREAIKPAIGISKKVNPLAALPKVDFGFYTKAVAQEFGGQWNYNRDWRPDRGFTINNVWLHAILRGHSRVAAGIDVGCPVLTVLSEKSSIRARWDESMRTSDSVLVVDDIAQRALKLGSEVTVIRITGALHDVTLSSEPARSNAYKAIEHWLGGYSPAN